MRRSLALLALPAALAFALPASADLRPVRRDFGDTTVPRFARGTVQVPPGHARGRITVVVRLAGAPLARYGRSVQGLAARARLNPASRSSRAYLARLDAAQRAAIAELRRSIPEARVYRRYRIVLNGLAVELPARRLPALVAHRLATRVYPSFRYRLALDDSPSVIGARAFVAATGALGDGIKIAVVDDGIDHKNRFFDPTGFSYPAGFPRGGRKWTSPKVIVARAFPGPGSGRAGRLPLDRRASFHGTHVAGIAAGDAGTTAPRGADHPSTPGLSGVAPRAWLGNYRVFNVPTPVGNVANTPEIVAAFEAAVADGMDVINFSGGGPQSEPVNDALIETVANVVAAGVVPVIAAGNDRDEFGLGTVGSPGTAPEAISVAATSNAHVFAPVLDVVGGPAALRQVPFRPAGGDEMPARWAAVAQTLVDIGTIMGTDRSLVERRLCGGPGDYNGGRGTLPRGSLRGAIALVNRGGCTFVSKAIRARIAGAVGIVIVDNRPGEANDIPIGLPVPAGMISDLDGARLRQHLNENGGRTGITIGRTAAQIETGRSGVVTSFSSAGPTAFDHQLKPDVAAPGGQILSSTLPRAGGPFAVFDGTSMAAPHVAGAAALLVQRHPAWTPHQVKSALVTTAGTAWADTARTAEAPVVLAGGGLVDIPAADDPRIFTEPTSLSYRDLNVNAGGRSEALLVRLSDAGGGAGTWQVELRPQAASAGAALELPGAVTLAPGGRAELVAVARAAADAAKGENYGFILLRRGSLVRKIPYFFLVSRPALESFGAPPIRRLQVGTTLGGPSRVDRYGYPSAPFGPPPTYVGPPMVQDGRERLYTFKITRPVANFGAVVLLSSERSQIDPWVLGSKDENDVQGYAGTPVNVNPLTFGYRADIGAAGAALPRPKTYYVSVDSGRDPFTSRRLAGRYILQSWVNDVVPPLILPVTQRVAAGRPTIVMRVVDDAFQPGSGVDPLSLAIAYRGVLVGAAAYDPFSGLAVFPLPREAPALRRGRTRAYVVASDYQEAKNVNTTSEEIMPNTSFRLVALQVTSGPAVTWLAPERGQCVESRERLVVTASSSTSVRSVEFRADGRRVATVRRGAAGVYAGTWRTSGVRRGKHLLRAVVTDSRGRTAAAERVARVCRR